MNMTRPIFTATALVVFTGVMQAADSRLLNLVMPDAKVLAGINVDQAKISPLGQYLITQLLQAQNQHLQAVTTLTGFDPTQNLHEILAASNEAQHSSGLLLAIGEFDAAKITAAAVAAGAVTSTYNGVTVVEDPKQPKAFAFLGATSSIAVAGDPANVKAAIDRQTSPSTLDATLLVKVNTLSTTEDAWMVSTGVPQGTRIAVPGANAGAAMAANLLQKIQQASGGVKFGSQIVVNGQVVEDTAVDATQLANVLQFFISMGQMQSQQNPQLATFLKSLTVSASGTTVQVNASIAESDVEASLQPKNRTARPDNTIPRPQRQRRRVQ